MGATKRLLDEELEKNYSNEERAREFEKLKDSWQEYERKLSRIHNNLIINTEDGFYLSDEVIKELQSKNKI